MRNISQAALLAGPIRHVGFENQQRIAWEIDEEIDRTSRLEVAIEEASQRSQALEHAVLEGAFSGELTRQDPADEPALALLDRIRAERSATPIKARRRRRAPSTTR